MGVRKNEGNKSNHLQKIQCKDQFYAQKRIAQNRSLLSGQYRT